MPSRPGLRADVDHRIARAARLGEKQIFFLRDAQRQNVHQRIAGIARLECDFAADRGHAETISVVGDAAHHAVEKAPVARDCFSVGSPEALVSEVLDEIGPKRSESSTAMGRAPMVKMSRRIPPTPVAAP